MKALSIILAFTLPVFPVAAIGVDLPAPGLVDQVRSWLVAIWDAIGLIGSSQDGGTTIVPIGQPLDVGPGFELLGSSTQEVGPGIDPSGDPQDMDPTIIPDGSTQEMGPLIDPIG